LGNDTDGFMHSMASSVGWSMNDVALLGVIATGLGGYCLHLQWKYKHLLTMTQLVLEGLKNGDVEIVERNGVFYPIPKQQQGKA
jgi:hypothetical protein